MATLHHQEATLSVRIVPRTALDEFLDPQRRGAFEKKYGEVDSDTRADLLALLGLAAAITAGKRKDWEKAVRDTLHGWAKQYENEEGYVPAYFNWQRDKTIHLLPLVNAEMNRGMRKARFIVWWAERERRFAPGLLCEDAGAALFGLALSRLGEPGTLSVCLRCGNPFVRVRRTQRYCGYRCQTAAGMMRYRKRLKPRAKKSPRKRG